MGAARINVPFRSCHAGRPEGVRGAESGARAAADAGQGGRRRRAGVARGDGDAVVGAAGGTTPTSRARRDYYDRSGQSATRCGSLFGTHASAGSLAYELLAITLRPWAVPGRSAHAIQGRERRRNGTAPRHMCTIHALARKGGSCLDACVHVRGL